jgi:hypothetical protein
MGSEGLADDVMRATRNMRGVGTEGFAFHGKSSTVTESTGRVVIRRLPQALVI